MGETFVSRESRGQKTIHYAPELEKRCRPHLKATTDSWRVDETYVKVKGQWKYLYRAVDKAGNTVDASKRAQLRKLAQS